MLRSVSYSRRLGRLHVRWLRGRHYVAFDRTARTAGSIKVYSYEVIIVENDFYLVNENYEYRSYLKYQLYLAVFNMITPVIRD